MADALDEKWSKLVAIAERLANQPAPAINVHIHMDSSGARKKRTTDQNNFGTPQGDSPDAADVGSRMPHPYIS